MQQEGLEASKLAWWTCCK